MPFGIGIWELLILLLVLLLVFGPKRLPEMGRQLGKGMREFKDSVTGDSKDDEDVVLPPAEPAVLPQPVLPEATVPAEPSVPAESSVPAAPAASESRERDTVS
jgi:sec-independent protein translocase protein TatA